MPNVLRYTYPLATVVNLIMIEQGVGRQNGAFPLAMGFSFWWSSRADRRGIAVVRVEGPSPDRIATLASHGMTVSS